MSLFVTEVDAVLICSVCVNVVFVGSRYVSVLLLFQFFYLVLLLLYSLLLSVVIMFCVFVLPIS